MKKTRITSVISCLLLLVAVLTILHEGPLEWWGVVVKCVIIASCGLAIVVLSQKGGPKHV